MNDLVKFLRARLNDDERVIHEAGRTDGDHELYVLDDDYRHDRIVISGKRAQDEVAAKRRIIDRYEQQAARASENAMEEDRAWTLEPVLLDLALPYASHPDYQQDWRP